MIFFFVFFQTDLNRMRMHNNFAFTFTKMQLPLQKKSFVPHTTHSVTAKKVSGCTGYGTCFKDNLQWCGVDIKRKPIGKGHRMTEMQLREGIKEVGITIGVGLFW